MILGLFSKAIAMSGTHLAPWSQPAYKGVARKRAIQLAQNFDCYKPNDWAQSIDCLRNVSAKDITAAVHDFFVNIWFIFTFFINLGTNQNKISFYFYIRNSIWIPWFCFRPLSRLNGLVHL